MKPRYWLEERHVKPVWTPKRSWAIAYRAMARSTDASTVIATALPANAVGNSAVLLDATGESPWLHIVLANLNSKVHEYAARQKVGGANLNQFLVKQFPVLPLDAYTPEILKSISERVLELTYTAHDMAPFARDLGYVGPPFTWDEDRRAKLRSELDGVYAHLYGISRDDFAYILDTFNVVRDNDLRAFGEYRTKRLCLEAYDRFAPETLRALELRVRVIELSLRKRINEAASGDVKALPSPVRIKLQEEYAKQHRDGAGSPSLRDLLASSYLTDLEKIARVDTVWPNLGGQWESKRKFRDAISDLTAFRNPMAHGREVSETVRTKGEAAITWFEERLGIEPIR